MSKNRVIIVGGLLVVFAIYAWLDRAVWANDFSKWEPRSVYLMVLGTPPPPGVTDIKVAGRHYVMKRWVWMTFHATPSVIRSILSKTELLDPARTTAALSERVSVKARYDEQDARHVGWEAIRSASHLVAGAHSNQYGSWQFVYTVFVDRRTNTVYVKATGD
ncbi:MAG TPA: hypothetical protein VGK19_08715 [Capsulimonadaceae bacterium]